MHKGGSLSSQWKSSHSLWICAIKNFVWKWTSSLQRFCSCSSCSPKFATLTNRKLLGLLCVWVNKRQGKRERQKETSSFHCLLNGQDLFCVYKAHSGTLQICCWGLFMLCCWGCGQIAPTINNHEVPSQACV